MDQVLFLPFSTAEQLGIYIVAVSLADMVRTFNTAVRDVVFSVQSAKNDDESLGRAARLSTIITAGVGVSAVLMGWWVVPLAFGSEFSSVTGVLAVVLVGTIIGNPGSVAAAGMTARGKPILRSIAILCSVVLNIVLLVILLPRMGAMGAAIASMVANGICGWLVLFLAYRVFGMKPSLFLRIRGGDDFKLLYLKVRVFAVKLGRGRGGRAIAQRSQKSVVDMNSSRGDVVSEKYLVSVATYMRPPEGLERLLDSLGAGTNGRADVIVVDNDPDGSARAIAESHSVTTFYTIQSEPGIAQARNKGAGVFQSGVQGLNLR